MSKVKSKNTSLELLVRRYIYSQGFRYRIHNKELPGKPDITFKTKKIAIFINGCFWHQHGCKRSTKPKSNQDFWNKKLSDNVNRDYKNINELDKLGWKIITLWECEVKKDFKFAMNNLIKEIY